MRERSNSAVINVLFILIERASTFGRAATGRGVTYDLLRKII